MSLRVENLTKAFGEHLLFRQLRFTIDGPAVLWAPSGWGKTTLLRILMGLDANPFQLVHERLVDVQAAGRIQDHKVVAMVLRVHDRAPRDLNRVALPHIEHRDAGFFADHLELLDSGRAVHVARDKQRAFALFAKMQRQLGRMRRFTGTL